MQGRYSQPFTLKGKVIIKVSRTKQQTRIRIHGVADIGRSVEILRTIIYKKLRVYTLRNNFFQRKLQHHISSDRVQPVYGYFYKVFLCNVIGRAVDEVYAFISCAE